MKNLLIPALLLSFVACKNGASDNKNEGEPYPTYDTTAKKETINSGSEDRSAAEPTNADPNHTTH